jgi:hypothetical protein
LFAIIASPIHMFSVMAAIAMISVRLEIPQEGVQISLVLYRIEQGIYWEIPAGSCVTDSQGLCEIQVTKIIRGSDGFLRGTLMMNGIRRAVIWPGGDVEVVMTLSEGPHENMYDFLSTQDHPVMVKQEAQRFTIIPALLAVLAGIVTIMAARAAKKQGRAG